MKKIIRIKQSDLNRLVESMVNKKKIEIVKKHLDEALFFNKTDDGLLAIEGKNKFLIYPHGNQFILQINYRNIIKGSLAVCKGAANDWFKNIDENKIKEVALDFFDMGLDYNTPGFDQYIQSYIQDYYRSLERNLRSKINITALTSEILKIYNHKFKK